MITVCQVKIISGEGFSGGFVCVKGYLLQVKVVEKVASVSRDQTKFQTELQVKISNHFFEIKYIFQTHQVNNMKS